MIEHKFNAGITTANDVTMLAPEWWDDAEDALAQGLEWAASRIRNDEPRAREIVVSHIVRDTDYGIVAGVDHDYMVIVIGQD